MRCLGRDNRSCSAVILAATSELGRASYCVTDLSLSPDNLLPCLYLISLDSKSSPSQPMSTEYLPHKNAQKNMLIKSHYTCDFCAYLGRDHVMTWLLLCLLAGLGDGCSSGPAECWQHVLERSDADAQKRQGWNLELPEVLLPGFIVLLLGQVSWHVELRMGLLR
ncbi:hypothetical protein V6N12_009422 [Hibiscus sabdariffa]|uniref:Uncharacterized protein n=1 Tax=Hibiscus sabdariffa TaxID=183260 RepID=A0ABR2E9K0_9ROSI